MKQYWQKIALKVDARTLRERTIIFAMCALVVITLLNAMILDPLFKQQKLLSQQLGRDQTQIAEMQAQIQQMARLQATDPDAANRELLAKLTQQSKQMQGELGELQKGLVSPDKMPELLEGILRRNGKLQLVSLKTLAPSSITEPGIVEQKALAEKAPAMPANPDANGKERAPVQSVMTSTVYKHGVEIVVRGGYLDMVSYMAELEAMPWQLFWGQARLDAEDHTKAQLTLTLYTLSLEKKWLNI
ncbi:MAG TPA: type II secretion system protein GspM [Noviherbaspirillum sp.]|nr:type II secretion system protein GspM [Noviherbaspirillum sp.]